MKPNIYKIEKDISNKLYKEVKSLLDNKDEYEEVLDNKLINDLFARKVALYTDNNIYKVEANEFIVVKCLVENGTLDVSVGRIKKNVNGDSKLTYGII